MSRGHHKQPDKTAIAARDSRRKALLAKAATTSGLAEDDLRVETLSWALLGLDAAKSAILRGEQVQIEPWQKIVDALSVLLPAATTLNIHFVESPRLCAKCQSELPPEAAPVEAAAAPSVQAVAATPATPTSPAPPVNVVPLRSVHDHVAAPTR